MVAGTHARLRANDLSARKQRVRERVWTRMERQKASRFPGARGRIPNFVGAEMAARLLAELPEWRTANALKANPDAPQLPVRARALEDGNLLYMAVPRLRDPKPFLRLDPAALDVPARRAASISGAAAHGDPVAIGRMPRIDLVVCGSVAVNRLGQRVGKGGGFSDLELALLREAGLIDDHTVIATTVHDLQLLDEELPETRHDFRVDLIATPTVIVRTRRRRRPPGIIWSHLGQDKVDEIPVLSALARKRAD